jgi:hypothetical protein
MYLLKVYQILINWLSWNYFTSMANHSVIHWSTYHCPCIFVNYSIMKNVNSLLIRRVFCRSDLNLTPKQLLSNGIREFSQIPQNDTRISPKTLSSYSSATQRLHHALPSTLRLTDAMLNYSINCRVLSKRKPIVKITVMINRGILKTLGNFARKQCVFCWSNWSPRNLNAGNRKRRPFNLDFSTMDMKKQ